LKKLIEQFFESKTVSY